MSQKIINGFKSIRDWFKRLQFAEDDKKLGTCKCSGYTVDCNCDQTNCGCDNCGC